jgi:hypothetical protein
MEQENKTSAIDPHSYSAAKKIAIKKTLLFVVSFAVIASVEVAVFVSTIMKPSLYGYLASAACGILVLSWIIHGIKLRYDYELELTTSNMEQR